MIQAIDYLSKKQGQLGKTYLIKTLFLLKQKFPTQVGYDFFPHKYGPFSQVVYEDLNVIENENIFKQADKQLTEEGKRLADSFKLEANIESELEQITTKFPTLTKIKSFVYENYPEYTKRSKEKTSAPKKEKGIYSIGYEGKTIDYFINQLIQNDISVLVDVRRNAFSMKKGFSKNQLKHHLEIAGIKYTHIPEFGIESEKRKNLDTMNDYKALFREYAKALPDKKEELGKLEQLGGQERIALMCFEADKNCCHRGVLSDFLQTGVVHI